MAVICNFYVWASRLYCASSIIKPTVVDITDEGVFVLPKLIPICATVKIFSYFFTHFFIKFNHHVWTWKGCILYIPKKHHLEEWTFNSAEKISLFLIYCCRIRYLSSSESREVVIGNIVSIAWFFKTCPHFLVEISIRSQKAHFDKISSFPILPVRVTLRSWDLDLEIVAVCVGNGLFIHIVGGIG